MISTLETAQSVVLVVDDKEINIKILRKMLESAGFQVRGVSGGQEALDDIGKVKPDLILLDLMMPQMDGFQVCEILRSQERTKDIPVIVVTANTDRQAPSKSLGLGAVDFVTKPYDKAELLARINTHLQLKRSQEALRDAYRSLKDLSDERNKFMGLVTQDMKDPIGRIIRFTEMVKSGPDPQPADVQRYLDMVIEAANQIVALMKDIIDASEIEKGERKRSFTLCNFERIARFVIDTHREKAAGKNVKIVFEKQVDDPTLMSDQGFILQILDNLIANAVQYSPEGKAINVLLKADDACLLCEVRDQGPGISEADQAELFTKFKRFSIQPASEEVSAGLGLSIVKNLVTIIDGKVWCVSNPGEGAKFVVQLPRNKD